MEKTYDAVIFDLDGTLLNTIDDLADSANAVLSGLGFATHSIEEYKYFVGNGIPKLIERCLPPDRQDMQETALKLFTERYSLHSRDKTAPYPGIKEVIAELKQSGIPTGVITNKSHPIALDVVKYYFGDAFDYVRGLDDTIKAKPAPDGALSVASALRVKPERVLYAGDTKTDMLTAQNAGFSPCGVLWGFRLREELEQNGARYIISRPEQLLDIIFGKGAEYEKTVS